MKKRDVLKVVVLLLKFQRKAYEANIASNALVITLTDPFWGDYQKILTLVTPNWWFLRLVTWVWKMSKELSIVFFSVVDNEELSISFFFDVDRFGRFFSEMLQQPRFQGWEAPLKLKITIGGHIILKKWWWWWEGQQTCRPSIKQHTERALQDWALWYQSLNWLPGIQFGINKRMGCLRVFSKYSHGPLGGTG